MNSFEPGQIIHNKSNPIPALVLTVKPVLPPCGAGSAFITVLAFGENKSSGPYFVVPAHWEILEEPRQ